MNPHCGKGFILSLKGHILVKYKKYKNMWLKKLKGFLFIYCMCL